LHNTLDTTTKHSMNWARTKREMRAKREVLFKRLLGWHNTEVLKRSFPAAKQIHTYQQLNTRPTFLFYSRPNRPHHRSCPSVSPSVPHRLLQINKEKSAENQN